MSAVPFESAAMFLLDALDSSSASSMSMDLFGLPLKFSLSIQDASVPGGTISLSSGVVEERVTLHGDVSFSVDIGLPVVGENAMLICARFAGTVIEELLRAPRARSHYVRNASLGGILERGTPAGAVPLWEIRLGVSVSM